MSQKSISAPRLIIGLGNPGPRFTMTRHNIGFEVVDHLADRFGGTWHSKKNAEYAEIRIGDTDVLLVKPQTFMNNSGEAIPELKKNGYKPADALVVQDELDLDFGTIKFKHGGSARGHNGIKSLIAAWGDAFSRLRVGVGRPEQRDQVHAYVLQRFSESPEEVKRYIAQASKEIVALYPEPEAREV